MHKIFIDLRQLVENSIKTYRYFFKQHSSMFQLLSNDNVKLRFTNWQLIIKYMDLCIHCTKLYCVTRYLLDISVFQTSIVFIILSSVQDVQVHN